MMWYEYILTSFMQFGGQQIEWELETKLSKIVEALTVQRQWFKVEDKNVDNEFSSTSTDDDATGCL
jgi:hypothetical protein